MKILYLLPLLLVAGCASTPPPLPDPLPIVEEPKPVRVTDRYPDERYMWAKQVQPIAYAPPPLDQDTKLVIDIGTQSWHHYENGVAVRSGAVATGTSSHPTPRGRFRAGIKQKNKRSSLYPRRKNGRNGGAPMHYAIQINGDIFLHEGYLPGHPASHGCVRVWTSDAQYLWKNIGRGDKIVVI